MRKLRPKYRDGCPNTPADEKRLLGAFLHNCGPLWECFTTHSLTSAIFLNEIYQVILDHLLEMREREIAISLISVTEFLEEKGILDQVGGAHGVTDIYTDTCPAGWKDYLDNVVAKSAARAAWIEADSMKHELLNAHTTAEVEQILGSSFSETIKVCQDWGEKKTTRNQLLLDYIDHKEKVASGEAKSELLQSPIKSINDKMGGYACGEMTICMGPTSSGKSLFGMEHILSAVFDQQMPSAIFTGEMSHREYMDRMFCNRGNIHSRAMRSSKFNTGEVKAFHTQSALFSSAPLEIYDQKRNRLTVESIESEVRKLHKSMGLRVVLIDYLQRLNIPRRKETRRDEDLGNTTVLFKRLAGELDMWFFVLSSTNDEGQVRDSRSPEYDTDNMFLITTNKQKVTEKLFVSKARNGPKSYFIDVEVVGDYCRFQERI